MNPRLATEVVYEGRRGASLRALVGAGRVRLDAHGVRAAFGEVPADGTMCVAGARWAWVEPGEAAVAGSLRAALTEACANVPDGRGALALSGGVDSAALAGLLRGRVVAYTLAPTFAGYGEAEAAEAIAGRLGVELRRVVVTEADFVEALPAAIRACETALYNLHPVSRLLVARAARADGAEWLMTGDGADEVFNNFNYCGTSDYLPIVGALTRAAGLTAVAPFLDPVVVASVRRDPEKRALRALAEELGVPEVIVRGPKRPWLAPAMDLARVTDREAIGAIGRCLGRAPTNDGDRARVGWTTLALLVRSFPGIDLSCVGSLD